MIVIKYIFYHLENTLHFSAENGFRKAGNMLYLEEHTDLKSTR